jgi:hypothetical protein
MVTVYIQPETGERAYVKDAASGGLSQKARFR